MEPSSPSSLTPPTSSVGMLIVGIGGANGTTLLSGIIANRRAQPLATATATASTPSEPFQWFGPVGQPQTPNYNGCITQIPQRGIHGGVGYSDRLDGLACANTAAVGGWDIRPTKLGDALAQQQILDYDLVRRVREEMNGVEVMRGVYDAAFIGGSQHATATHTRGDCRSSTKRAVETIRTDIREFKAKHRIVGHTTVVWSASVEPHSELVALGKVETAEDLLKAANSDEEAEGALSFPPSLVYATAAVLEGCSFVNGGSQNTLCGGLTELAQRQSGVYVLGTDFKAGQTKFKTAAVEYLRTMGLTPKVIASSNHLGNNDMRNLATADAARHAKLRVKHDIFAPWGEDIDHKVCVMYTPMINDEKRDFVEYTSLGFLGQVHTMATYTRASDSVLCVPLMIDACVWCDYFSGRQWPYEKVAQGLAYLFKVPEGAAKGVDPGFFRQMEQLTAQALDANRASKPVVKSRNQEGAPLGSTWSVPSNTSVICAGLACVDMQLGQATGGGGGEGIDTFQGETSIGGGSVSMACKTLARLCYGAPTTIDDKDCTPVGHVFQSIIPLCKVGNDDTGNKLISLLESSNVNTTHICAARKKCRDTNARTALAVLPIYQDGRRGCFFDAASNASFGAEEMVEMITGVVEASQSVKAAGIECQSTAQPNAFLFGYPHLLPNMQGKALARIFTEAKAAMTNDGITVLDLNGVPECPTGTQKTQQQRSVSDLQEDPIIGPALKHVDILHMNEEELASLTCCDMNGTEEQIKDAMYSAIALFIECGVGIVALTRGKKGCVIVTNNKARFELSKMLPISWAGITLEMNAVVMSAETSINTNGAGDSFTAGLLAATMLRKENQTLDLESASQIALHVAAYHIDQATRDQSYLDINVLLDRLKII